MASGPYWDKRRGTYSIQWFNGKRWTRTTVFKVPGWTKGKPEPKKTPPEAMAALKTYAEKEKAARSRGRAADPERTVKDFLAAYQAIYKADNADLSADQLRMVAANFLAWCGRHKVVRLADVTAPACQRWVDDRSAQTSKKTKGPITPKRLAVERAILSGAWTRAVRLGELPENPWSPTTVPGLDRARRRKDHKPSWTPEEFARLIGASKPWLRDLLTLGTQTGIRIGALLSLEWRDVKWAEQGPGFGDLAIRPELDKAARGYSVPLSRTAHDLLARRFVQRDAHARLIMIGPKGNPTNATVTGRSIKRACKRAGLPAPTSPNHHMRRTFGRWAILGHLTGRPVPLYVVSKWLGHSTTKITETYLDVREQESADWMAEFTPGRGDDPPAS
jgi:integrase